MVHSCKYTGKYLPLIIDHDVHKFLIFAALASRIASILNEIYLSQTARLIASYCAPSRSELITNMQNRLVHHLISTKLRCALPKCTSVQNYMTWVTPTSHGHTCRSPLCTIVHNAGGSCTNAGRSCTT